VPATKPAYVPGRYSIIVLPWLSLRLHPVSCGYWSNSISIVTAISPSPHADTAGITQEPSSKTAAGL
jgi:hypothetical protein